MSPLSPFFGLLVLSVFNVYAENEVNIIDAMQTEGFLESGAVFIDNRPEYKYALGHIRGAFNLPFMIAGDPSNRMTKENLIQALGDSKVIVFYCTGHQRAYHALKQAKEWGIPAEMYWYKNGFTEWDRIRQLIEK